MRLLLVEDDLDFADSIIRALDALGGVETAWARSRDAAIDQLNSNFYDLVILDRRIPTANDVMDDRVEHGWNVFQHAREVAPGTPVWFLTGTEDPDFAMDLLNDHGRSKDIHGRRIPEPMYRVFWKKRMPECLAKVREFVSHLSDVERVHVRSVSSCPDLGMEAVRTIQGFGRRYNGTTVDASLLSGGLSDSLVLKVVVRNAANAPLITAVAKVAPLPSIQEEADRYQAHIVKLTAGGYPALADRIDVGARNHGGLFYPMVGSDVESLFSRLAAAPSTADTVPTAIRFIEQPWTAAKADAQVRVEQVRRRFISDTALLGVRGELHGIAIEEIEGREIRAATCCRHNDLHCANVVFDQNDHTMLIDFGDADLSFSAVDAVSLELSTVFHPQGAAVRGHWPSESDMEHWADLAQYTENCPFASFVVACRSWALDEAASEAEVVAVSYSYAMRQLKYVDTDKDLARALIRACITALHAA